jgi:hypothetical protein
MENQINLSKEAKDLVKYGIRPGVAAVWHDTLRRHFDAYGASRMMVEKVEFDRAYLDMHIDLILKNYGGKIQDVKKDLDKVWKQSKTNYDYFLTTILFVSTAIDVIENNKNKTQANRVKCW